MSSVTGTTDRTSEPDAPGRAAIDLSGLRQTGLLINGTWLDRVERFAVLDKFAQAPSAYVSSATDSDVDEAVQLAYEYMSAHTLPASERAGILERTAELVELHRDEFVQVLAAEAGFSAKDARNEVDRAARTLRICAQEAVRVGGEVAHLGATPGAEARTAFTKRFPIGIVCAITPFNSPLNVALHKIGPAIAAGNAVIVKAPARAPLSAALVSDLFLEAGLPPRLISVVNSADRTVAARLLADQRIAFYAFTGSTTVGRVVAQGAGIRPRQLELGSIASTIVGRSADLDRAIPKIANAAFRKAGQVCTSTQRLYVAREVLAEVEERLIAAAVAMRVGDPLEESTVIGPMISKEDAVRVEALVAEAVADGARVLAGDVRRGALYSPTIVADLPADARILHEEIFGPAVCILPFDGFDAAIAAANDTPFGLSCGVFTNDVSELNRAISQLRFGAVHVNEASSARVDEMPFGGVKDSGLGFEGPAYAIREMTEERLITLNPTG